MQKTVWLLGHLDRTAFLKVQQTFILAAMQFRRTFVQKIPKAHAREFHFGVEMNKIFMGSLNCASFEPNGTMIMPN